MKKKLLHIAILGVGLVLAGGCKKSTPLTNQPEPNKKVLSPKEEQLKLELKQFAAAFGEALKDKALHKSFNLEINRKLEKTGFDEAISLNEIYGVNNLKSGLISSSFASQLKAKLQNVALAGEMKSLLILDVNSSSVSSSGKVMSATNTVVNKLALANTDELPIAGALPVEVYYPYSENFPAEPGLIYTVTSNPLDGSEENVGARWNSLTNEWEEVMVNDAYTQANPTYIITVDDGYQSIKDLINDLGENAAPKEVILNDIAYQLVEPGVLPMSVFPGEQQLPNEVVGNLTFRRKSWLNTTMSPPPPDPNQSQVTTLFVKDVRCTEVPSIFEGKTEFAFAVPSAQDGMTLVDGNPSINSAKILTYAMKQIKRKKVRDMYYDLSKYESVGWTITNWKSGDAQMSFIIYELDRPFLGSADKAKTFVDALVDVSGIFTGGKFNKLVDGPVRKMLQAALPGAKAAVKHSYYLDRDEVYNNQFAPNNAMNPSLLNGLRPYGGNAWMVNYRFQ